jgi:outer membrane protein assembly factor BamD (BamD/ComL family)
MRVLLAAILLLTLSLAGCSGDAAHDLFDAAQLEERQNNPTHAKELYQQILSKHPGSEYAPKAQERLRALEKGGGSPG